MLERCNNSLRQRFQFKATTLLVNRDATREGILDAIARLIDAAKPGDVVVFYYAGHGSQRLNSLAPARVSINHMDQTIVPADAGAGQFDIRNVELTSLFSRLLDKGVHVTLIFDSCHSGSAVRGEPMPGRWRYAPFDLRDARDPSDPEPLTSRQRKNPALVLAATQEDQLAEENNERDALDGAFHGAFTSALLEVLRDPMTSPNEAAERTFRRVQAIMRWRGKAQVPVLKGAERNHSRPFFGDLADSIAGRVMLALQGLSGDTAILDGGLATGLGPGSELHALGVSTPVRVRIAEDPDIGTSRAIVLAGNIAQVAPGGLFAVDKWRSPVTGGMRVWMPAAISQSQLSAVARESILLRRAAGIEWTNDPTDLPDDGRLLYVAEFDTDGWHVKGSQGDNVHLTKFTSEQVVAAITVLEQRTARRGADLVMGGASPSYARKPRLFVLVPPSTDLRSAIARELDTSFPFRVTSRADSADYALMGRVERESTSYAWILPNATAKSQHSSPFPARTDWIAVTQGAATGTATILQEQGLRLSRVFYWLSVQAHDTGTFPYDLLLREQATGREKVEGDTTPNYGGEQYSLVLRRNSTFRGVIKGRWVYVFAIDSRGEGNLLFGQSQNHFPVTDSVGHTHAPVEQVLPAGTFRICKPYGVDTFIMVTTPEPLDAPTSIFNFEAIRTRGVHKDGGKLPATDWSIQRLAIPSQSPPVGNLSLKRSQRDCRQ